MGPPGMSPGRYTGAPSAFPRLAPTGRAKGAPQELPSSVQGVPFGSPALPPLPTG